MTAENTSDDFYRIPTSEQLVRLQALAERALEHWGAEGSEVRTIKYRENAVFAVTRADGERFVMRLHRPGYRTDANVRSEFAWMRGIAASGLLTPEAVPTVTGEPFAHVSAPGVPEPRRADLLSWVDGAPLGSIEEGASGDVDAKVRNYRTLGQLAARIHDLGTHWTPPADFDLPSWDRDALVGEDPEWGRFWELDCLTDAQRAVVLEARGLVRRQLDDFGTAPDRFGLLHGDCLPENVLVDGEHISLLDFNDAGYGYYSFEFATSLFFLLTDPDFETVYRAMLDGYASVRELPAEHERIMPVMIVARGLSYLGWPASRPEIDDARDLAPLLAEFVVDLCERHLAGTLSV